MLISPSNRFRTALAWSVGCILGSIAANTYPTHVGCPLTNKTVLFSEAYMERWEVAPSTAACFDVVRYILPDAIDRSGTTETEAVIKALEITEVETSLARQFVFTSSHDIMVGELGLSNPDSDHYFACLFQW